MPADSGTVFLLRPQGDQASVIGGGVARVADAERVALKTAHGRVLVKSIRRESDRFEGEVYAVMPREPDVAAGDHVRFSEAHIFAFKVAEGAAPTDASDEIAQMARTFEESFRQFDATAPKDRPRAAPAPASRDAPPFDMDISALLQDLPEPPDAPVHIEPTRSQPAAKAPRPPEKDAALSTAEAMSILRAAEQKGSTLRQRSVDPVLAKATVGVQPVVEKTTPPVKAPPAAPMQHVDADIAERMRTESVAAAPKRAPEPIIAAPKPAANPVVAAPQRLVEPSVSQPRRLFQPGIAETKLATPAVEAPEPEADAVVAKDPTPSRPLHAEVTPATATPQLPDVKITCRECGAPLIVPPPATDDASEADPKKVSCRKCGRINDVKRVKL